MTTKKVTKIADKLGKVSDSFTVTRYDNGYAIHLDGRDHQGCWTTTKLVCNNIDELFDLVKEATTLPPD